MQKEKDLWLQIKNPLSSCTETACFNLKPPLCLAKQQEWQWWLRAEPPPICFPLSFLPFFIIITPIALLKSLWINALKFHFWSYKVRATSFLHARVYIYIYIHTHAHTPHKKQLYKPLLMIPVNHMHNSLWAYGLLQCSPMCASQWSVNTLERKT